MATIALTIVLIAQPGSTKASAGAFDPTITLETSTTRATAHPDARITIDNTGSAENIKDLKMSLPDGFWGSLGAVNAKCTQADAESGDCASTTPESKIGTVTASAKIEDPDTGTMVNGVLSGDIFMTEAFTGNNDPAGVSIVVRAKVGGVDLGKVVINGRAVARMVLPTGFPASAVKDVKGLDTVVENIPQEITDGNARTVAYHVDKMQIDLISRLQDPGAPTWDNTTPLLTNPSRCGTYEISATATPYGGGADKTFSDDYVVDQCDTARFDPIVNVAFANDPIAPSSTQGVTTEIQFASSPYSLYFDPNTYHQPESNSSFDSMKLVMPRGFGANFDAFNIPANSCPGSTLGIVGDRWTFKDPQTCPPQAQIGTAYILSPLSPSNYMTGNVMLINNTPLPALAIAITDDIPGNVPGINIYLVGTADLEPLDPGSPGGEKRVIMTFSHLPDTPVSYMYVDLNQGPRAGVDSGGNPKSISGELLKYADNGTANCQPETDLKMTMGASSGESRGWVQPFSTSCTGAQVNVGAGPWGQVTDDTTPTFDFTYSGAAAELFCGIDTIVSNNSACKAALSYTPPAPLAGGAHSMIVADGTPPTYMGSKSIVRDFAVQQPESQDNDVPNTTLSAGPGHSGGTGETDDSTPSFTFNASETSSFQCSLDDGAFLPCGSATGSASETHAIAAEDYLEAGDTIHTFAVRAQDSAGNVDLTPAEASFKIVKPFAPTMSVDLTTTQSRAHPEMDVTIQNPSHTRIKDLYLNMPDGFMGGITSVTALCPVADADAGTCSAGSQIGTVDTVALIARSTAYITGKVFLTEPRIPGIGEPAGLTIDVEPKIQDVTFKPIRINARLSVRGEAQGLDSATMDIPDTAESTIGEISTFDLRKMVLKLRNNPAASQPLLTNPSYCGPGGFTASFVPSPAAADAAANESVNFTGCQLLGFGPQLAMRFTDHTTGLPPKAFTPRDPVSADLDATLVAAPGDAGIRDTTITMPKGLTINPAKTPFACPSANYPDNCPANSYIGTVEAVSPLLPEVLTGSVYMLQGTAGLPRIFVRLRGRINVNIVATNRFVNIGDRTTQMETKFTGLPDVPLSSFHMKILEFLTTREYACDFAPNEWNAYSRMDGWNGAVATGIDPLQFGCPNVTHSVFDDQVHWKKRGRGGKKSTLSFAVVPQSGRTLKKVRMTLPKGTEFIKSVFARKRINRYVKVTINGDKKLSSKCFWIKGRRSFTVDFCKRKKKIYAVKISFRKGSIQSRSRHKTLKLKVITVDNGKHKQRVRFAK